MLLHGQAEGEFPMRGTVEVKLVQLLIQPLPSTSQRNLAVQPDPNASVVPLLKHLRVSKARGDTDTVFYCEAVSKQPDQSMIVVKRQELVVASEYSCIRAGARKQLI